MEIEHVRIAVVVGSTPVLIAEIHAVEIALGDRCGPGVVLASPAPWQCCGLTYPDIDSILNMEWIAVSHYVGDSVPLEGWASISRQRGLRSIPVGRDPRLVAAKRI